MDSAKKDLLRELNSFIKEVNENFSAAFWDLMKAYEEKYGLLSEKIKRFIKAHHFDKCSFIVVDQNHANEILEDLGLDSYGVGDDSFLVVFNLPKPLAQYWWKGKGDWGTTFYDTEGMNIEWGTFYRYLLPYVWQIKDSYDRSGRLLFTRINYEQEHDPLKYYYIWEVSAGGTLNTNIPRESYRGKNQNK